MAKVNVGDHAPEFELAGTGGNTYRLSQYRGKWVILAFYPGDFTLVCTRQFCSYRDGDDLTVPLLADEDREVIRAYGVGAPGGLVRRSIFIVDPGGVVRYRHIALLGLHYKDISALSDALAAVRP